MRRPKVILGLLAVVALGAPLAAWRTRSDPADGPIDPTLLPAAFDVAGLKPAIQWVGPLPPPPDRFHGSEPTIAADAAGRVVVVALDHGAMSAGPRLLQWASADGGKTWPAAAALDRWPTAQAYNHDPWLGTDGKGRFFLALLGSYLGGVRVSEDGGRTWGAVIDVTGKNVDKTLLAVAPGGQHLAFLAMGNPPGRPQYPPVLLRSADAGRTWAELPTPAELRDPLPDGGWVQEWTPPGGQPVRTRLTYPSPFPTGLAMRSANRLAAGWLVWPNRSGHRASVVGTTADGGKTWTLATLATCPENPSRRHNGPVVACDRDGTLFAAHAAPKAGGPGLETQVRSSADGRAWSEPVRVSSSGADTCRYHAVSAAATLVHLAWVEERAGKSRIWYRGSADGGKSWSDPLPLGGPPAGDAWELAGDYLSVADDGRGTAHVVWSQQPRDKPGAVWYARVEWTAPRER